jgi:hypothetical protein
MLPERIQMDEAVQLRRTDRPSSTFREHEKYEQPGSYPQAVNVTLCHRCRSRSTVDAANSRRPLQVIKPEAAQSLSLATRLHDKERAAQPFSFFGVNYEARIPLHFLISSLQPRRERSLSRCSDEFLPSRCFAPVLDPRCFDSRPARIRIVTKITGRWQCGLETDWSLEARHHNVKCDVSCPCSTSSTHLFTRTHQAVDNYTGQRRDRVSARRGAQQKVPSPCLAASPRAQSRPPRVASRREPGNLNMIAARLNTSRRSGVRVPYSVHPARSLSMLPQCSNGAQRHHGHAPQYGPDLDRLTETTCQTGSACLGTRPQKATRRSITGEAEAGQPTDRDMHTELSQNPLTCPGKARRQLSPKRDGRPSGLCRRPVGRHRAPVGPTRQRPGRQHRDDPPIKCLYSEYLAYLGDGRER